MALPKNKSLPNKNRSFQQGERNGSSGKINTTSAKKKRSNSGGGGGKQGLGNRREDDGKTNRVRILGGNGKFYGGLGGYKGVNLNRARRLTEGVLRAELSDLRGERRTINRQAQSQTRNARRDYERGIGDLDYVHGETGSYLESLRQQNADMYNQQAQQTAAATAALGASLTNNYSGAQQSAMDELARLGVAGGGNFTQLISDQANAQGVAAQSGANMQGTQSLTNSNAQTAMAMLQGMNQGSHMQGAGQNLNRFNDARSQIRTNRMDQLNEVREAMQNARNSRNDVFYQLLEQMQNTGWNQYLQLQQLRDSRKGR